MIDVTSPESNSSLFLLLLVNILKTLSFWRISAHIHNIGDKLENILVSQCRKVLCDSEINELDEEKNLVRKSRDKLINIDLEQAKKLSDKEMFVGSEVEKELKALGLRWNSRQVK